MSAPPLDGLPVHAFADETVWETQPAHPDATGSWEKIADRAVQHAR
ncbi:hypothetical protein [Luteimonas terrae]|uniref:Uncharacterized protein n=1 Tax=Luteimonas terrae TaxID=1530191 RepID=A0ABU1XVU8_9GAMM|nr:hypothetical protein [Luteimonas terrae]MDR7192888.1 hypothetical protein [Luteimonas terrae]